MVQNIGYGLGWEIWVPFHAEARLFFASLCWNQLWVPQTLLSNGPWGLFLQRVKCPWPKSCPHSYCLVVRLRMYAAITPFPICLNSEVLYYTQGQFYLLLLYSIKQRNTDEYYLLGYSAKSVESQLPSWRIISPPYSGSKFLWNVGWLSAYYMASYLRRESSLFHFCLLSHRLILRPWRWRRYIPLKCQLTFNKTTWYYIRKDSTFLKHISVKFKSYIGIMEQCFLLGGISRATSAGSKHFSLLAVLCCHHADYATPLYPQKVGTNFTDKRW
jgi:hypothetical protein